MSNSSDESIYEQKVKALLDSMEGQPNFICEQISYDLADLGQEAVTALIKALENENSDVRSYVAYALGRIGDRKAIEPLFKLLATDDVDLGISVVGALTDIGGLDVQRLIKELSSEDWRVRGNIASILRELKDERAIEPLILALDDKNENVVYASTSALIGFGKVIIPDLVTSFKIANNKVRSRIAYILAQIKEQHEQVIELLTNATENEDFELRYAASYALNVIKTGDNRSVEDLIIALKSPQNKIREYAAIALSKNGGEALQPLIEALKDNDSKVRWQVVVSLKDLGDKSALAALMFVRENDKNKLVRDMAAEAIKTIQERLKESNGQQA